MKGLNLDQPWQTFIKAFNTFSKYYNTIVEEVSGPLKGVLRNRALVPWSLQGVENPEVLSEVLRTRMDQKFEDERRRFAQQYEGIFGILEDMEEYDERMAEFLANSKKCHMELMSRINEAEVEERRSIAPFSHESELRKILEVLEDGKAIGISPVRKPLILEKFEAFFDPNRIDQRGNLDLMGSGAIGGGGSTLLSDQKIRLKPPPGDEIQSISVQTTVESPPSLRLSINPGTRGLLQRQQTTGYGKRQQQNNPY